MLVRPGDFKTVHKEGTRHVFPLAVVFVRYSEGGALRVGISAGRRIGKAVLRNRVRRRFREAVRQVATAPLIGADVVIVPRQAAVDATFDDLVRGLGKALRQVRIVSEAALNDSGRPRARE